MTSKQKYQIVVLALCIVAAVGYWTMTSDAGISVKTVRVDHGPLLVAIDVTGRVSSSKHVSVISQVAGQITAVRVEEGEQVKEGQLLVEIDAREANTQLLRSQFELQRLRAEAYQADEQYAQYKELLAVGGVARQVVDGARMRLEMTRAAAGAAMQEFELAKLNLEKMKLRAPFSGTITQKAIAVGQWVNSGDHLVELVDFRQRYIVAKMDAADSIRVAPQQDVDVSSESFPGHVWTEKVAHVGNAVRQSGSQNLIEIRIGLSETVPPLKYGEQVDVKLRMIAKEKALRIPANALIRREGTALVAVIKEKRVQLMPVVIGMEDLTYAEIVSGVSAGEEVIIPQGKRLEAGEKVIVSNSKT